MLKACWYGPAPVDGGRVTAKCYIALYFQPILPSEAHFNKNATDFQLDFYHYGQYELLLLLELSKIIEMPWFTGEPIAGPRPSALEDLNAPAICRRPRPVMTRGVRRSWARYP